MVIGSWLKSTVATALTFAPGLTTSASATTVKHSQLVWIESMGIGLSPAFCSQNGTLRVAPLGRRPNDNFGLADDGMDKMPSAANTSAWIPDLFVALTDPPLQAVKEVKVRDAVATVSSRPPRFCRPDRSAVGGRRSAGVYHGEISPIRRQVKTIKKRSASISKVNASEWWHSCQ